MSEQGCLICVLAQACVRGRQALLCYATHTQKKGGVQTTHQLLNNHKSPIRKPLYTKRHYSQCCASTVYGTVYGAVRLCGKEQFLYDFRPYIRSKVNYGTLIRSKVKYGMVQRLAIVFLHQRVILASSFFHITNAVTYIPPMYNWDALYRRKCTQNIWGGKAKNTVLTGIWTLDLCFSYKKAKYGWPY